MDGFLPQLCAKSHAYEHAPRDQPPHSFVAFAFSSPSTSFFTRTAGLGPGINPVLPLPPVHFGALLRLLKGLGERLFCFWLLISLTFHQVPAADKENPHRPPSSRNKRPTSPQTTTDKKLYTDSPGTNCGISRIGSVGIVLVSAS